MKTLYDIRRTKFYTENKNNQRVAIFSPITFNFQGIAQIKGCKIDLETVSYSIERTISKQFIIRSTRRKNPAKFCENLREVCYYLEDKIPYIINPYKRK